MNINLSGLNLPAWVTDNLDAIAAFEPLPTPARECLVTECTRDSARAGLCRSHFVRARDTYGPIPPSRDSAARRQARTRAGGPSETSETPDPAGMADAPHEVTGDPTERSR